MRRFLAANWLLQGLLYAGIGACAFLPATVAMPACCLLVLAAWAAGGVSVPAPALLPDPPGGRGRRFYASQPVPSAQDSIYEKR